MSYKSIAAAAAITLFCAGTAMAQTALEKPPSALPGQSKETVDGTQPNSQGAMTNNGAMAGAMNKRATTGSPLAAGDGAGTASDKDNVTGRTTSGPMNSPSSAGNSSNNGNGMPLSGEKGTMVPTTNSGTEVGGASKAQAGN